MRKVEQLKLTQEKNANFLITFLFFFFGFPPKVAPICKPGQKIIYGVAHNEIVQITCEVEAEPSNVNFKWSLNSSNENAEIRSFITNGSISIATYRPRNRFAYGALACWAVNDIGVQRDPCIFNIIPTGELEISSKRETKSVLFHHFSSRTFD